eukprot:TRINITY_DN5127_c0_g2_i1.p1 TRINITY_DN5127_c0_g2~~TRINITY_DN5127_c0_g2_i1.p1  ORF type:complete len:488 (+),score=45.07 TRINITY_DN5127_c0_g2_i1:145-1608(+)
MKLKDHSTTQNHWMEIGTTEWKTEDNHISFLRTIELVYCYEEQQEAELQIWAGQHGVTCRYIGQYSTTVAALVGAGKSPKAVELANGEPTQLTMTVQAREISEPREFRSVFLLISGTGLDKKDLFSSDPFLEFYRMEGNSDNQWRLVHTTEVHASTLEPKFNPIKLDLGLLCNYNMEQPFLIKCWDKDSTSNDFIGECLVTLSEIRLPGARKELINHAKGQKKKNYVNSGVLLFDRVAVSPQPSRFHDYLAAGWKLSVQFVTSYGGWHGVLGTPYDPDAYDYALSSMANIMAPLCHEKFLVYGFGGRIQGRDEPVFSLTNTDNALVTNVEQVRAAYVAGLKSVRPEGRHLCGQSIHEVLAHLEESARNGLACQTYTVQFIFTNGVAYHNDLPALLVRLSRLPVSVILVDLSGRSQFVLEYLDGDNKFWKHNNEFAERDVFSFVDVTNLRYPVQLKHDTLRELPEQFCWYQGLQNQPLPRVAEEEKQD